MLNVRLLRQLTHNYKLFHGNPAPTLKALLAFMHRLTAVNIEVLEAMVETGYPAFTKHGYTVDAKTVCAFLAVNPEDIFGLPPGIKRVRRKVDLPMHPYDDEVPTTLMTLMNRLRKLDDGRMATIIRERFGLADGREHTLEEIGQSQGGLSRERIRQIEASALRHLRKFAVDSSAPDALDSLYKLRLAARENAKRAKQKYSHKHTPTFAQLTTLRKEVESGLAHLQELGINL